MYTGRCIFHKCHVITKGRYTTLITASKLSSNMRSTSIAVQALYGIIHHCAKKQYVPVPAWS